PNSNHALQVNADDEKLIRLPIKGVPLDALLDRTDAVFRKWLAEGKITPSQRAYMQQQVLNIHTSPLQRHVLAQLLHGSYRSALAASLAPEPLFRPAPAQDRPPAA